MPTGRWATALSRSLKGMPAMDAAYTYTCSDDVGCFTVTGDLDLAAESTLGEVAEWVGREPISTVWIDLSGVEFIDCAGLGLLIGIKNTADTAQRLLILQAPSDPVCRLLDVSGLTGHFLIK
jgi:anti-anti-sigma factor